MRVTDEYWPAQQVCQTNPFQAPSQNKQPLDQSRPLKEANKSHQIERHSQTISSQTLKGFRDCMYRKKHKCKRAPTLIKDHVILPA